MSQTILLTGISGFVAKHVALVHLGAGYTVRGTLRNLGRGEEVRRALAPHLDDAAMARLSFAQTDLDSDAGWDAAMQGIDTLVHTASPFPLTSPRNEGDLIRPAVDGTLRALRAAHAAHVNRVVLTSSTVAIVPAEKAGTFDEANWADASLPTTSPYAKSKILAEQAAWSFARSNAMALTTINPGLVLGAPLDMNIGSSVAIIQRIMKGKYPMLPQIDFSVVDVVDVARMHLYAVQNPATADKRYACVAGRLSMVEIGRLLKATYPTRRIPTRVAPKLLLRLLAVFESGLASILPSLDKPQSVLNARAVAEMKMTFTPPKEALKITANWLDAKGLVWAA
jgi:dihydroflavonol-4-reductase